MTDVESETRALRESLLSYVTKRPRSAVRLFQLLTDEWGSVGERRLWRCLRWLIDQGAVVVCGRMRSSATYTLGTPFIIPTNRVQRCSILNDPRCVLLDASAFDVLPVLPDNFCGLVCSDSPYGERTHAKYGKEHRADGAAPRIDLTFKHLSHMQVEFLAEQYVRLSQGWIIVFTDDRSLGKWGDAIEASGGKWIRTMSWVKSNPMPQLTCDRPGTGEEFILLGHSGKQRLEWNGKSRAGVFRGGRDTDAFHVNQKPLWLMQELLGLFAKPGDLVLDPFAGSASTGVVALYPERVPGLYETSCIGCPKCSKALAAHIDGRPPLPERLSFVGLENDPATLPIAQARLLSALEGKLYDPQ